MSPIGGFSFRFRDCGWSHAACGLIQGLSEPFQIHLGFL